MRMMLARLCLSCSAKLHQGSTPPCVLSTTSGSASKDCVSHAVPPSTTENNSPDQVLRSRKKKKRKKKKVFANKHSYIGLQASTSLYLARAWIWCSVEGIRSRSHLPQWFRRHQAPRTLMCRHCSPVLDYLQDKHIKNISGKNWTRIFRKTDRCLYLNVIQRRRRRWRNVGKIIWSERVSTRIKSDSYSDKQQLVMDIPALFSETQIIWLTLQIKTDSFRLTADSFPFFLYIFLTPDYWSFFTCAMNSTNKITLICSFENWCK